MRRLLAFVLLVLTPAWGQFGIATPLLTNTGGTCGPILAPGAPQFVQFSNSFGGSFNDTVQITGVTTGNALVVTTAIDSASGSYPPANTTAVDTFGNTFGLVITGTTPYKIYVWVALNVTGGAGVDSINVGNSSVSWDSNPMVAEFSGVAHSSAVDGTPAITASATLAFPLITGTVTTSLPNDLVLTLFGWSCHVCGITAACTFATAGGAEAASWMAYQGQPVAGTFGASWIGNGGFTGTRDNTTVMFALKP